MTKSPLAARGRHPLAIIDFSQYKARAPGHRDMTNRLLPGPLPEQGGSWEPGDLSLLVAGVSGHMPLRRLIF